MTNVSTRPHSRSPFEPRSNLDAEAAVLGIMMSSPDAIAIALDHVTLEDFYRPSHAALFGALVALYNRNEPIDLLLLHEELTRRQAGAYFTPTDLTHLQLDAPTWHNVEHYANLVANCAQLRRLDGALVQGREAAATARNAADATDLVEQLVFGISSRVRRPPVLSGPDLADAMVDEAVQAAEHPGALRGLSTGLPAIDRHVRGLRPGQFIVVGARPSVGKTALALSIALSVARSGKGVLFCSLEMSGRELAMRLGALISGVDSQLIESGEADLAVRARWNSAADELAQLPLWVDDDASLDVTRIKARARRRQNDGLGLVVVDYLQLISTPGSENRQIEVSTVSRGLKVMAKQLGLPVLALSQLSRKVEDRLSQKPLLSDLRESGSLEQDADVVVLLSRDTDATSPRRGLLDFAIAKNRNGPTGLGELVWQGHLAKVAPSGRSVVGGIAGNT